MQKCKFREVIYPYTTADGEKCFEVVRKQFEDGSKQFLQRRQDSEGKTLYNLKGVEPVLYRLPAVRAGLENGQEVVVCEGEKDADALATLGFCATTAPMGAGKWREGYTDQLQGARRVLIAPDNDRPGRAHAVQVAAALEAAGIPVSIADLVALYPGLPRKGDVSDVLEKLGVGVAQRFSEVALPVQAFAALASERDAQDEAPPYVFDTAAQYLEQGFWADIQRNKDRVNISTGFAALDKQLDGGLYPGLYVVGSVSSLGKTAFCLQMADHIAAAGHDVLFFTLEMSRQEMVARSLTRQLFLGTGFRSEAGIGHILYDRMDENALRDALGAYKAQVAQRIAFVEGDFGLDVAEVAQLAARHVAGTARAPVIFVDYLQILRPADVHMTDKQATDHNIIELKRLSRDLDIPVVVVSSFNRQNYAEEVNMAAFKESGAIEYSADFVLALQARGVSGHSDRLQDDKKAARMVKGETKNVKQQTPRPLEAVTLKNRRGPAWACFDVDFYPKQNYFVEV